MNPYFPVFLQLRGRTCVVVGGGQVAARKIESLLDAGAQVRLVSPRIDHSLNSLIESGSLEWRERAYQREDLLGAFLVIAATDDPVINERISKDARELGVMMNVVDEPALCDFIVPSVIERGDIVVAISTGGKSPALAKHLRQKVEESIGPEYADFAALLGSLRDEVKDRYPEQARRAAFWQKIVESDIPQLLKQGRKDLVEARISAAFEGDR